MERFSSYHRKVAPTVGSLLGGSVGASVGGLISAALGVDNTPSAVNAAIANDPATLIKIKELENSHEQRLKELQVEELRITSLQETQVISDVNKTMQSEAASEHWPTYSWRPFIGFCVGFNTAVAGLLIVVAYGSSWGGHPDGLAQLPSVLGALAGVNATALPILGIASWFRGKAQADPEVQISNKG